MGCFQPTSWCDWHGPEANTAHGRPMLSGAWRRETQRDHRAVTWPSPTARPTRRKEETGASTSNPWQLTGPIQWGDDPSSGWCVGEAVGMVRHGGVCGGGGTALVPGGDGGLSKNR
jgi:hypothetical protein